MRIAIGGCAPFGGAGFPCNSVAGAEPYLCAKFHLDAPNSLATIHQRYGQTDMTDRQDSQDNGPIA